MIPQITLCTISLVLIATHANHLSHANDADAFSWSRDRMYAISRDGPMAAYFSRNASEQAHLVRLVDHFRAQERLMAALGSGGTDSAGRQTARCNRVSQLMIDSVVGKNLILGFGRFHSTCITSLSIPFSPALFRTIEHYVAAVQRAGSAAVRATGIAWPHAYTHARFQHNGTFFQCALMHAVGFRVRGRWGVMSSVTEFPTELTKSNPGRRYMVEFLTTTPARGAAARPVGNLLVRLPSCESGRANRTARYRVCDTRVRAGRPMVPNATTTLEEWGGKPAASIFRQLQPLARNPAVRVALARVRAFREQAEDATTASNVAIMVLSAALSLVPIAAFAEVTWRATLAYALCTDLFACMPLFIKGIELIALSRRTQAASVSWVYGMETATDLGVVETWSAKCHGQNSLQVTGALFVAAAIAAVAVGTALELWARRRLYRKKQKYFRVNQQIFAEAGRQLWMRGNGCVECQCYTGDRRGLFPFQNHPAEYR